MKYFFSTFSLLMCLALVFFSSAGFVHAQYTNPLKTSLSLEILPENPGPNQSVVATVSSYDTDLNAARISWSINGQIKDSGTGKKTFTFVTGGAGTATRLSVTAVTAEGETISKTYSFRTSNVDLIWQANGYVPPFFKGKTLFSYQNPITFVAVPHLVGSNGQEIPAKNLIYTWTRNGSVAGDFSGYGKNTYTVVPSIISRPLEIHVEVTSPNNDAVGSADTVAAPVDPLVLLYPKDPLQGIKFNNAIGSNIVLNTREIEILSVPFFFGATTASDQKLLYTWNINGVDVPEANNQQSQVFRPKEGTAGTSNVGLEIKNSSKVLQYSSINFNLKFNAATTSTSAF